jgi:hypothetical protein
MPTTPEQRRESRLRSKARRQGLRIHKSRIRTPNADDLGGYRLVDSDLNLVIAGERFDLDLDGVEKYLSGWSSDVEHDQQRRGRG